MQITVLAIGARAPGWVEAGIATYTQRLPRNIELTYKVVASPRRAASAPAATRRKLEADLLRKALPRDAAVVALDAGGEPWSSADLAARLERWQLDSPSVVLLIGGADGIDETLRLEADRVWSLSALTLPHALVRVVVAEQVYRAWTMLQGHPYHRE